MDAREGMHLAVFSQLVHSGIHMVSISSGHLLIAKVAWSSKCLFRLRPHICCGSSALQHVQQKGCLQADAHPLFVRMSDEELAADLAACLLDKATEEGQKVARNSGLVSLC